MQFVHERERRCPTMLPLSIRRNASTREPERSARIIYLSTEST
jgi:hypothetical protein